MLKKYYYEHMNDQQKQIYNNLSLAINNLKSYCTIFSASQIDIDIALKGYIFDQPNVIQYNLFFSKIKYSNNMSQIYLAYNNNDINKFETELSMITLNISKKLRNTNDNFTICKIIYDYLIEHSSYSYATEEKYFSIDKSNDSDLEEFVKTDGTFFSAYGPIVEKKGTCMGIALAYKLLLDYFNVEATCAMASISTCNYDAPHTVNVVEINGNNMFVDLTRGFPLIGLPMIRYDFFLVTDDVIKKYCILENDWNCTNKKSSYFKVMKLEFNTLRELRNYLYSLSYKSTNGQIRFYYSGTKVSDEYLTKILGAIINDRCGREYKLIGYFVENGIGNCLIKPV